MNNDQRSGMDPEEEAWASTPFDPKVGIWFKYGRIYEDRTHQVEDFEAHCGFSLPKDFLDLIGDYCEGGFDGWYQIKTGNFGSIVWTHLLLMKLPDSVDREIRDMAHMQGRTFITTELLQAERSLFYSKEGRLLRFPFGSACCFRSDKTGSDGYLVFDIECARHVKFISEEEPKEVLIATSFSGMMERAVFQCFG